MLLVHPTERPIRRWSGEQFGVATQAHIELKSRLEAPAPLFVAFMKAAKEGKE